MKKLQLPISNTFTMFCRSDFSDLTPVKTEDGKVIFPLGRIDFKVSGEQAEEARQNAALVIWAVISIEQRLNTLIANYLFGPVIGEPKPKRDFLINHILNSDALTLAKKRALVFEIVSQEKLLIGKDKEAFSKLLAKMIKYRNAFAHGNITIDTKLGALVHYFSGTHQSIILDDSFWTNLEQEFKTINDILQGIENHISKIFIESLKTDKK
jgi:hypothetical protein